MNDNDRTPEDDPNPHWETLAVELGADVAPQAEPPRPAAPPDAPGRKKDKPEKKAPPPPTSHWRTLAGLLGIGGGQAAETEPAEPADAVADAGATADVSETTRPASQPDVDEWGTWPGDVTSPLRSADADAGDSGRPVSETRARELGATDAAEEAAPDRRPPSVVDTETGSGESPLPTPPSILEAFTSEGQKSSDASPLDEMFGSSWSHAVVESEVDVDAVRFERVDNDIDEQEDMAAETFDEVIEEDERTGGRDSTSPPTATTPAPQANDRVKEQPVEPRSEVEDERLEESVELFDERTEAFLEPHDSGLNDTELDDEDADENELDVGESDLFESDLDESDLDDSSRPADLTDDRRRKSHRKIPSWQDAVGAIVARNMESRGDSSNGASRRRRGRRRPPRGNRPKRD